MGKEYDVVKADTAQEAIAKAPHKVGDLFKVKGLRASANGNRTYSVFYEFEPVTGEKDVLVVNKK